MAPKIPLMRDTWWDAKINTHSVSDEPDHKLMQGM
jgi:hypothetical protein